MTIRAKFAGTCGTCRQPILVGQSINWVRGAASTHAVAADCVARPASAPVAPVATSRPVISLSGLVAFLKAARERGLKFPKTRFAAPGNGELLLSLAGDTSRNPGAVYVKLNGEYAGKVTAEGVAYGLDALLPTLRAIEADPAAAGAAYGALTGRCSFCGLGLTDEGSVEVGYGPVCAKRYGLPHSPKGSAKSVPVVHASGADVDETAYDFPVTPAEAARIIANTADDDGGYVVNGPGWNDWKALKGTSVAADDCDGTQDWNERAARESASLWRIKGGSLSAKVDARIDAALVADSRDDAGYDPL